MARADWTPAVLIASTVSLTVVTVVLMTSPVFQPSYDTRPGPARPRHALPDRVAVWVGDLDGGLRAMLSPVWGDAEPDAVHDRTLNAGLAVQRPLAFYELMVFNPSDQSASLALPDGALRIQPTDDGGDVVSLQSVSSLVESGRATPSPALRTVLLGLGSLRPVVEIEPGAMAILLVAFDRRVDLEDVVAVSWADGTAFRRRPIARERLEALLLDPTEARVGEL